MSPNCIPTFLFIFKNLRYFHSMRRVFIIITYTLICLGCNSNTDSVEVEQSEIKIMMLGDSRVDGSNSLNGHQSYRYELWKNLIDNNFEFDFIGNVIDVIDYPSYQGNIFDPNHSGYGGYKSYTILDRFVDIVDPNSIPDLVLLGIGGNDLTSGNTPESTIDNINVIVDFFQALNPEIKIIIEQIAPAKSDTMTENDWLLITEFNRLVERLPNIQQNEDGYITVVNMAENWQDEYLYDRVHYSNQGAKVVADRYFDKIIELYQ